MNDEARLGALEVADNESAVRPSFRHRVARPDIGLRRVDADCHEAAGGEPVLRGAMLAAVDQARAALLASVADPGR